MDLPVRTACWPTAIVDAVQLACGRTDVGTGLIAGQRDGQNEDVMSSLQAIIIIIITIIIYFTM